MVAGEQAWGSWRGCPVSAAGAALVRRSVDRARLARLGLARRALPSELLSAADRARIARKVWGAPPPQPPPPPPRPAGDLCDATVRATLCAISRNDR